VMGINSTLMHYVLMTLVAVTTVASFESVGSILVIAMLIVPAAAAHLLTDRLHTMIFVSVGIAALAAALGHVAALTAPGWFGFRDPVTGASLDTSTAGMMAVVAGVLFTVTMIAAPRHGLVSKAFHQAALRLRITREDVLGFLYRLEELGRTVPSRGSLPDADLALVRDVIGAGPLMGRLAVRRLTRTGHVRADGPALRLTDEGRAQGQFLLRSHRLWESYLHQYLNLAADHVHAPAERLEHITSPRMQQRLAERTDQPETDPQGKDIPPLSGPLRPGKPELVFYDGGCGLCHATVRFLLRRDTEGDLFAFAPLGGEAFSAHVPPSAAAAVPDSILVLTRTGSMLTRSTAVLHLLERLGGFWAVAASSARSVPRPLRDACYRLVARIRNRLFAKPEGVCPRVPEHLRSRFRP